MEVPEEVEKLDSGDYYQRLKKVLYRLKQAGRQWKKKLHKILMKLGFNCILTNNCFFISKKKMGELLSLYLFISII